MSDTTYLKDDILTTQAITASVKEQTLYQNDGLQGSYPFLRADRSGNHKLVFVLIQKTENKMVVPKQVVSASIADGTVLSRESAEKFYASLQEGITTPIGSIRKDQDRETAQAYREKALPLMDEMRLEILEHGETSADKYMEYLKYSLYPYTDELAERFLRASRIFVTASSITIPCSSCGKKFQISTSGLIPGKIISNTCPFCQDIVQTSYVRTGKCITFTDRYMEEYRLRSVKKQKEAEEEERHTFFENLTEEKSFSVEASSAKGRKKPAAGQKLPQDSSEQTDIAAPLPEKEKTQPLTSSQEETSYTAMAAEEKEKPILTPVPKEVEVTEAAVTEETSPATMPTVPIPPVMPPQAPTEPQNAFSQSLVYDYDAPEHKSVKSAFAAIREILASDCKTPPVVIALVGNPGSGILTSLIRLSGFKKEDIRILDADRASREDFTAPCTVLLCNGSSPSAEIRDAITTMQKGQAIFLAGTKENVDAAVLSDPVINHYLLYRIFYKAYKPETLYKIMEGRFMDYGVCLEPTADRNEILTALSGIDALAVTRICAFLYFKCLMNRKTPDQELTVTTKELLQELTREKQKTSFSENTQAEGKV